MGFSNTSTGEAEATRIINYLNSNPGYIPEWATFKAQNPTIIAQGNAKALDYFAGGSEGKYTAQWNWILAQPATGTTLPTTTPAPGTTPAPAGPSGGLAKAMYNWATQFKLVKDPTGNTPLTRDDWSRTWGDLGGAIYDWGRQLWDAGMGPTPSSMPWAPPVTMATRSCNLPFIVAPIQYN